MFSQRATNLAEMSSSVFQTVYSKLQSAESSSHGRYERHQELLSPDQQSSATGSNTLELGPFRASGNTVKPAIPEQCKGPDLKTTVAATLYWSARLYSLPIGTLHAQVLIKSKCNASIGAAGQELEESNINLTFVPPRWLSRIMFRCDLEICHKVKSSFPSLMISITPVSINTNPLLYQAVEQADVEGLQYLFRTGLARPTDYIPDGSDLVSLLDVGFRCCNSVGCR